MKALLIATFLSCGAVNAQTTRPLNAAEQAILDAAIQEAYDVVDDMPPTPERDRVLDSADTFREANAPQPDPGDVGPPRPRVVVQVDDPGQPPSNPGMRTTPESDTPGCVTWTEKKFEGDEEIRILGDMLNLWTTSQIAATILHEGQRTSQSIKRLDIIEPNGPPGGVGPPAPPPITWYKDLLKSTLDANSVALAGALAAEASAAPGSAENAAWKKIRKKLEWKKGDIMKKLDFLNC